MKICLTYGTFDLLHTGHINLLNSIKECGDKLIVFVSSDSLNEWKGKKSFIPEDIRLKVVSSLKSVDEAFYETDMYNKNIDIEKIMNKYGVDKSDITLFIGPDWDKIFYDYVDGVNIITTKRTEGISSTEIKDRIKSILKDINE